MAFEELENNEVDRLSLRPFVEADQAEVTSWFADAGELRFFAGPRLTWPLDDAQWRNIRLDPRVTAWTGVLGDSPLPIGHGELIVESSEVVRLARLAVAPRVRGRGLGRAMLKALIENARASGHTLIGLHVHQDNSTAIHTYRSFGFQSTGEALAHSNVRLELPLD